MSAFTPGPWFYTPVEYHLPDIYTNDAAGKWSVASVNSLRDEYDENAHLIAAAPELYAALQDLIPLAARAMHEANRDGAEYLIAEELQGANAALAKARGEHD